MGKITLKTESQTSAKVTYTTDSEITIQSIENDHNLSVSVAVGDVVASGTEIETLSAVSEDQWEKINGVLQTPKVVITYA